MPGSGRTNARQDNAGDEQTKRRTVQVNEQDLRGFVRKYLHRPKFEFRDGKLNSTASNVHIAAHKAS